MDNYTDEQFDTARTAFKTLQKGLVAVDKAAVAADETVSRLLVRGYDFLGRALDNLDKIQAEQKARNANAKDASTTGEAGTEAKDAESKTTDKNSNPSVDTNGEPELSRKEKVTFVKNYLASKNHVDNVWFIDPDSISNLDVDVSYNFAKAMAARFGN